MHTWTAGLAGQGYAYRSRLSAPAVRRRGLKIPRAFKRGALAYSIVYLPPALGRYAFESTQVFQSGVLFEFVPTYDLDVGTPLRHEAVPASPALAHAL